MCLFGRAKVAVVAAQQTVVRDDVGPQFEQWPQLVGPLGRHQVRRVPPEDVNVVVGKDFLNLRNRDICQVFVEAATMSVVPALAVFHAPLRAAGMHPVLRLRIVEADLQPMLFAGGDQRLQQILAIRRSVDDIPIGNGRVEQGEAVVMLAGDDDILHAGRLGEPHPGLRIVLGGIELLGILTIVGHGDLLMQHDPLADAVGPLAIMRPGRHGVDAPVDEEAKAGLAPPGHALVAVGGSFGCRFSIGVCKVHDADHR